jgi:hypothetical protein
MIIKWFIYVCGDFTAQRSITKYARINKTEKDIRNRQINIANIQRAKQGNLYNLSSNNYYRDTNINYCKEVRKAKFLQIVTE